MDDSPVFVIGLPCGNAFLDSEGDCLHFGSLKGGNLVSSVPHSERARHREREREGSLVFRALNTMNVAPD